MIYLVTTQARWNSSGAAQLNGLAAARVGPVVMVVNASAIDERHTTQLGAFELVRPRFLADRFHLTRTPQNGNARLHQHHEQD